MDGQPFSYQDAEAFCQLYSRAHLMIFRFIYGLTGGPQVEVEDLTAETFIRAWKSRSRFQGDEAAAIGWLLQIARNLVIDSYRRKKSHGQDLDFETFEYQAQESSPEQQLLQKEQQKALLAQLQRLPPQQREMLVLRYILGWPVKRIAAHLGILENTVSVTIKRSLERLRTGVEKS